MNTAIMTNRTLFLEVKKTERKCDCLIHQGDLLVQFDATLVNGVPVRVLLDRYGIHASVGTIPDDAPAPLVSEKDFENMIYKALQ